MAIRPIYHAIGRISKGEARCPQRLCAKMGIAIEEADESIFWFALLVSTDIATEASVQELRGEANEIVAILTASHKTAKRRRDEKKKAARAKARPSRER